MHLLGKCFLLAVVAVTSAQVPECQSGVYNLIPKLDCRGYYLCVFGKAVEMPDCPRGSVFSKVAHVCVPENSIYNDCTVDSRPVLPDSGPLTIEEQCSRNGGLIAHPTECHAYYNCSHSYTEVPRYFEQHLQECPYPELFNSETMKCDHFENVKCGNKVELKNGCEYRRNKCPVAHCIPCSVWLPNCVGKPNGMVANEVKLWSPYYAVCYKDRTMAEKTCLADANGRTQLFHPELNQCVSLDFIPKEHGGMMPSCTGQKDGFYLDDFGRCDQYTVCKDGKFLNNVKCMKGEVFDVLLEVCVEAKKACGPCGNRADC